MREGRPTDHASGQGDRLRTGARWPQVLMYHAVFRLSYDPNKVCVSPERFESQMLYLKRRGLRGVSVGELFRAMEAGNARGLVGLTFDDGYANFLQNAVPVLERFGFTATVFVVGGMLGKENSWDREPRMKLLDAAGVREASDRGMEIGSHGMSHVRLSRLDAELLEEEVAGGQRILREVLGRDVEGFCYPYGDLDWPTIHAVRRAGHSYACAYKTQIEQGRYDIPRVYVGERDGALRFALKLIGQTRLARITRAFR
jgi:peptidoglycan/xylan/chitin deacetylase (PgdA/CDA1 family)